MKILVGEIVDIIPSMCIVDIWIPRWLYLLHYGTLADLNEQEIWKEIDITPEELYKLIDRRAHIKLIQ